MAASAVGTDRGNHAATQLMCAKFDWSFGLSHLALPPAPAPSGEWVIQSAEFALGAEKFRMRVIPCCGPKNKFLGVAVVRTTSSAKRPRSWEGRANVERETWSAERVEVAVMDTRNPGAPTSSCTRTWTPAVFKDSLLFTLKMLNHARWRSEPARFSHNDVMTITCSVFMKPERESPPSVVRDLFDLINTQDTAHDVELVCSDESVGALKVILAARSPNFFRVMFYDVEPTLKARVVVPEGVPSSVVKAFVKYAIDDCCDEFRLMSVPHLSSVFLLADMWDFPALKQACQFVLVDRMDPSVCCSLLVTATTYNCLYLKEYAMNYFRANAAATLRHEGALQQLSEFPTLLKELMVFLANGGAAAGNAAGGAAV
jgi:hypothetical protein